METQEALVYLIWNQENELLIHSGEIFLVSLLKPVSHESSWTNW